MTDAGVRALGRLTCLESLNLCDLHLLTDAALSGPLAGLTRLTHLDLVDCNVSAAAVEQLQARLPAADILTTPSQDEYD